MATDFTQDTVLHFLQISGGSVKNADLLLHFKNFIRDHPDRDKNRELFKKYVNSVATVKQNDGVSHVVLRKKFKGYVPGSGEGGSPGQLRLPAEKNTEPSTGNTKLSPSGRAEKPRQKPQVRDVTTPAPPGVTSGKTILPAAGLILNNNNKSVETNLNLKQQQQQVVRTAEVSGTTAPKVESRITEKTEVKTPSLSEPPVHHQHVEVGQHRVGPGQPVVSAVRRHEETRQQVPAPEPMRERQPERGLHEEPPPHHIPGVSQVAPRRFRYRPSYKSAVSCDEDDDDEEEEVPMRTSPGGGVWPISVALGDEGRAVSVSSPCVIDPPTSSVIVSSSSSSERKPPKIYIQDVKREIVHHGVPGWSPESEMGQRVEWVGRGQEPGSVSGESTSSRRSLPVEAEHPLPSPDRAEEEVPHYDMNTDRRYPQTAGVQVEPRREHSQRAWLSSSHNNILFPPSDAGLSISDWPQSGSNRGLGRSYEDLLLRAGKTKGGTEIPGSQENIFESGMHHADRKVTPAWHHSTGHLLEDQESMACGFPFHLSTGNLYDDHGEAGSSDGSTSSPQLRQHPVVARQLSRQLRSRMCHSMGADLDQLLQEETRGGGGGNEAARLNRLHTISSSLSLRYNLSSSSLSSCSTPPRCHSLNDLIEGVERKGGRRSLPTASPSSTAHPEGAGRQSLVPLEAREHAWLVKGAAGAWPDIYSLFREDSSLLNRRDFISGFTVLHWIAKHGDHRVLNTLWYGVQKAGLTFDINARSTCGHTPLHIAAIHGHKNIMRLLVNKFNADVRLRDTSGKKPWQYLSHTMSSDIFQLLEAPSRTAGKRVGGVDGVDTSWKPEQHQRHRRRHYLSTASSGGRPLNISGTTKVKRSSSIAAFLKHKSLHRLHGHLSDSSI